MIDRFERFSLAISEISRYWHKIAGEEMAKYGLKGTHSIYLIAMHHYPDGVTAPQLCEICGKDKSDVSRMISILTDRGLVTKEGTNQKMYGGVLKLTEEGMLAANHVCERAGLAMELAGKGLTDTQRIHLYESLELIVTNLRELSKEGLPPQ